MNFRQAFELYKAGGHFRNLNQNNLDLDIAPFSLPRADESSIIELLETGLTDFRVPYEQAPFDHPEICVPHGHSGTTGRTLLVGIPAIGQAGSPDRLQTFEEQLSGVKVGRTHTLKDACTMNEILHNGGPQSEIDVP